ncbi:MAG: FAD-dependent thymidylate synthase [Candidatus Micrarchaeia archaeon]
MPGNEFSPTEKATLARFCTSVEGNVFVLTNLPEIVKGTLFSRYSRSPKGLKRLLLDEFIGNAEAGIPSPTEHEPAQALDRAEKFYERVLVQYGDDSVAELAGAHLAVERASNLATKFFEDRRIGLSPLEKSSRYVYFNEKIDGEYQFYRDAFIMGSKYADDYLSCCNLLFDTYTALMGPMQKYYTEKFPRGEDVGERAYESAIRAKVCDSLRGLLPASTLTNFGLFGNARAFEYAITLSRASPLGEIQDIGKSMHGELSKVFPVLLRRTYSAHGDEFVSFIKSCKCECALPAHAAQGGYVSLEDYDKDGEEKVVAAILYSGSGAPMSGCIERAKSLGPDEKRKIIAQYVGNRTNRRHRPGRAFENTSYLFDICSNFGAYRDLHRHRILTQERQLLSTANGYDLPHDLVDAGVDANFKEAMEFADDVYRKLAALSPVHAQYVVPFAYRVRWYIRMNLREAYHLIELRSQRQGHPDYRRIAQMMYAEIRRVHPLLAEPMQFVDLNEYDLERLEAEKRIDGKLSKIN